MKSETKYRINEIFYSLQGEGARAGSPNVFVRFSSCNLTCGFCDTEFESGVDMSAIEVGQRVAELMPEPRSVILTGGEPLMQYDEALEDALRDAGVSLIACETNGSCKPMAFLHYVACSPKVAEHVVAANFPDGVDELRYVRHPGQGIPRPSAKAKHLFVSPQFDGDVANGLAIEWCVGLCKGNPPWRLSVQQHKLWKLR